MIYPKARINCLECDSRTYVSNSRGGPSNTIIRQRKCTKGHIFSTEESYAGATYAEVVNGHAKSGPWYVCPSCAGEQDPENKSVWNIVTNERMGLETYVELDNKGFRPQPVLGILGCPRHPGRKGLPQELDAQEAELRKFLGRQRTVPGGIQPVRG